MTIALCQTLGGLGGSFDDPSHDRPDGPGHRDSCCVAGLLRAWSKNCRGPLTIAAWLQGLAVNLRTRWQQAWPWVHYIILFANPFSGIFPLVLNLSRPSWCWYTQVAPDEPDLEAQYFEAKVPFVQHSGHFFFDQQGFFRYPFFEP